VTSDGTELLRGNGAGIVREIALAKSLQERLERLYQLERVADVSDFTAVGEDDEREMLWLREEADGGLEIALRVPALGAGANVSFDRYLQVIEGVSHFVYLAERWRRQTPVSHLELETQAEVDKYVLVAAATPAFDQAASRSLRERLYEGVHYMHDASSETGERYRVANRAAAAFTEHLEQKYVRHGAFSGFRHAVVRFFHSGRESKLGPF
jgi:hypothetical protein